MSAETASLGGRLPLLRPDELSPEQKRLHDRIGATLVPWAEQAGFQARTDDGRLIGPFNPILFSPALAGAFLDLQEAEQHDTALSDRMRQVVILTVGAVWASDYERYAHTAVARQTGLSAAAIAALCHGETPDELGADERVAQRFTQQLASTHAVEPALYAEAQQALEPKALVDLMALAGIYGLVCGLLNGFAIPAPKPSDPLSSEPPITGQAPTQAKLTLAAEFPVKSFLENLAIRADNSVLVSKMLEKELWYVPPVGGDLPVQPVCIHTFDQPTLAIVETAPDVFHIATSNLYTSHECFLHRLDLRGWAPGQSLQPELLVSFPAEAKSLNGACLIAPGVLLLADSFGGMIWRVDLPEAGAQAAARLWLKHPSMDSDPNGPDWTQPGINGLKFHSGENRLYYTSTVKQLFMRVACDPDSHEAIGEPEFVAGGRMADDFLIHSETAVAYLTTHRQNSIDCVPLDPAQNLDFARNSVASYPPDALVIGPSAGAWGRGPGEAGRVAYFLTDGGTKSPPKQGSQPAKLLRMEFSTP